MSQRRGALPNPGLAGDSLPPPLLRPLRLLGSAPLFPPPPARNLRCPREMAPISLRHALSASDRLPTDPSLQDSSLQEAPRQSMGFPCPPLPDSSRCAQCIPASAAPQLLKRASPACPTRFPSWRQKALFHRASS